MKKLKEKIAKIPKLPGVYKFFDEKENLIYIGKATNLKSRVRSYFSGKESSPWRSRMSEKIEKIETIVCENPVEALILETNLIKSLRPKFNVLMKDDKNLVFIKVTQEDFPKIEIVRKVLKDKAKYFGPKTSKGSAKKTLDLIRKIFPFRTCENMPKNPCLDFHIKRCLGPCSGQVSKEKYQEMIQGAVSFLKGNYYPVMKMLKEDIQESAKKMNFERCERLKKQFMAVKDFYEKQRVSDPNFLECDAVGFFEERDNFFVNHLKIRDGKIIDSNNFTIKSQKEDEIPLNLKTFIQNFYSYSTEIPNLILIPKEIEDQEIIEKWLSEKLGEKVSFEISSRGQKDGILNFAFENAKAFGIKNRISFLSSKSEVKNACEELAKNLNIRSAKNLECFDISHLSGTQTVGSSVAFIDGNPEKSFYRRYKIKELEENKIDDFASIKEILKRRYQKQIIFTKDKKEFVGKIQSEILFKAEIEELKKDKILLVKQFQFNNEELFEEGLERIIEYAKNKDFKLFFEYNENKKNKCKK